MTETRIVATPKAAATRRLAVADRLLRAPALIGDTVWPKACTWLIRLALEHSLDKFWTTYRPEVAEANRRAQMLVLTRTVDDEIGHRCSELWHTLSNAAHHHAYELSPTARDRKSVV